MRKSQEISIKLSEARSRLNKSIETRNAVKDGETPSADLISEMDQAAKAISPLEVEYRAAILAEDSEDEKNAKLDPDAEHREADRLLSQSSIMPFLAEGMSSGGQKVEGKEAELRAAMLGDEAREGLVPFEMLLPPADPEQRQIEHRVDAATPVAASVKTQGSQASVLERVFSRSIAARLLVSMPSVPVGSANYPILTSGTTAAVKNPGTAQDAEAGAFEGFTLDPKRLTARYLFRIEDMYKLRGYESVLRRDLAAVMSDAMDAQIVSGDGTAPNVDGFLSELAAPAAKATVTAWDEFLAHFTGVVDGLNAYALADIRAIVGSLTFQHTAALFRTGANDNGPREAVGDYVRQKVGGLSVSSRIPATVSAKEEINILAKTSYPGRNAVAPIWRAFEVIRDPYSGAASGEIALTAVALWNFKILRETGFGLFRVRTVA